MYKHYFKNKAGLYYYINSSGVVDTTSTKTPLKFAPDKWEEIELSFERGWSYFGMMRKISTPLEFVKDGATILKYLYFNYGINAYCNYEIEKFNNTIAVYDYELFFNGEINFVGFKSTKYNKVSCEIIEGGFLSKLEARQQTKYEIDLYHNSEQIWVKMDGINLQFKCKWIGANVSDIDIFPDFQYLNQEGTNLNLSIGSQVKNITINSLDSEMLKNNTSNPITFELTYNFNYNVSIGALTGSDLANQPYQFRIKYMIDDYNTSTTSFYSDAYLSPNAIGQFQSATFLGTAVNSITLQPNQALFIIIEMYNPSHPLGHVAHQHTTITQISANIELSLDNKIPTTYVKCLRPKYVLDTLISNINVDSITIDSTLLTDNENKVLTCGDSLRNLENAKLKTNLQDFFKSFNRVLNCSMSYSKDTNTLSFEEKDFVFDDTTTIMNLGEVSNLEITPHTQDIFSKLLVGYNSQTYDEVNGKDEFNQESEFLSPLERTETTLNLKSEYRADMYGIELTRLNLSNKTITDADSDNDVFFIHINNSIAGTIPSGYIGEGNDYYEIYRDNTLTIDNIYSPTTAFNLFFSPKRCLLRHGNYLHSILFGNNSEYIKFQSSSKSNYLGLKMVTTDSLSYVIDEGANELINNLDNILFKPFIFTFKNKQPINMIDLVNSNNFGKVEFTYNGNTYYGFLLNGATNPNTHETQTFKLLCAPSSDIDNLIY